MKIYIATILTITSMQLFASGQWGSYRIKGVATLDKSLIKNDTLHIKIGELDTICITDEKGQYEFLVVWSTFHAPGVTIKEAYNQNPKFITITYLDRQKKIKNHWKPARSVLLGRRVFLTKHRIIKYEKGNEPGMWSSPSSTETPSTEVVKKLKYKST